MNENEKIVSGEGYIYIYNCVTACTGKAFVFFW